MKSHIDAEKETFKLMIRLYCRKQHGVKQSELCAQCTAMEAYAMERLNKCVFGEQKPTCGQCPIHCYNLEKRKEVKTLMRFVGPRMPVYHPIHFTLYLLRKLKHRHPDSKFTLPA